jgi:pimeloyl-ACP methyl ester carboxylesterase
MFVDAPAAMEIAYVQVNPDIQLRRMVSGPARPKGTVLLLHGFPETLYAWKGVAARLSRDYQVHAFDWPGFGQSSRPGADRFAYAPRDYAKVLRDYIQVSGIDRSTLVIYATDVGALPALLAAIEQPDLARQIIVGDFAPFNRPQYMSDRLQALKVPASSAAVRNAMNSNRDEILENAYRRGLEKDEQFDISPDYRADMEQGWISGAAITPVDAFSHYYAAFTRDQDYFEANMARLKVPVKVVWGERDIYIKKEMGEELASRNQLPLTILPKLGHYPHLQDPQGTAEEVRAAFKLP